MEGRIYLEGVTLDSLVVAISDEVMKRLMVQGATNDKTLTTGEVCKLLNVTRQTLSRWEKQGVLTPNRIGRKLLYYQKDVLQVREN